MKVLIIGSGGREHALVWKVAQSPRVKKIYCAPGNGGIEGLAECVTISPENIQSLAEFAQSKKIDLTLVGPELPLSLGVVDEFEKNGLKVFGPRKNAAIIESSKCFTKEFCTRYKIPTAPYTVFRNATDAKSEFEKRTDYPVVIKADGLASGKGVIIVNNKEEANKAVDFIMVHEKFGDAGRKIIVEDFMKGEEATFLAITDGENFVPFESSQDHKAIYDNDQGPNTGGMGAYSPAPIVTPKVYQKICDEVVKPLLEGMKEEDRPYRGILYAGLMIADGKPRLVEFNCRFGDPEAQAVLFRLKSDLIDLVEASLEGKLASFNIEFYSGSATCIVMSSQGYPGSYDKGKLIEGLTSVHEKDVFVFHAGTKKDGRKIFTNGGRVLGVTARGKDLKESIDKAYSAVSKISWDGTYFRKDIGKKGLSRRS